MEINITRIVSLYGDCMERFSSSVAESGLGNIGAVTWRNACEAMADREEWLTDELAGLVDHFADYGAWKRADLEAMSGAELNALLLQFIAGDYQARERAEERGELETWEENEGGRLWAPRDLSGQWFYMAEG
jgi:hypothetical protein